ncbi:MAG: hypothetical protein ACLQVD_14775 [Capsulimonadaceae bacterium]
MTYNVTSDPETEAAVARRAARRGISVADYVAAMASQAVRKRSHRQTTHQPATKTGAQIVAELNAEGLLTGLLDS